MFFLAIGMQAGRKAGIPGEELAVSGVDFLREANDTHGKLLSGKTVVNSVREHGAIEDVTYLPTRKELVAHLVEIARPGDLLITQGAGDVTQLGPAFIEAMREREDEVPAV